jgi:hypothetical protein
MRLYHFTNLLPMIGMDADTWDALPSDEEIDLCDIATPSSILNAGLRPCRNGDYDHLMPAPLPECVWLTSNPDMPSVFTSGPRRGDWRVTVVIPESDRRLISWRRYWRKKTGNDFILNLADEEYGEMINREVSAFFVYFGSIARDRIREFVDFTGREDTKMAA